MASNLERLASDAAEPAKPESLSFPAMAGLVGQSIDEEGAWAAAEKPLVADLRALGFNVGSAWDLPSLGRSYAIAVPLLLTHLERGGYPDRVAEGIAVALGVKEASPYWSRIKDLYLHAKGPDEQGALASALVTLANRERVADLIDLVTEKPDLKSDPLVDPRILFLRPILRYGGEPGLYVIKSLRDDPVFVAEATALLKQHERARSRRR